MFYEYVNVSEFCLHINESNHILITSQNYIVKGVVVLLPSTTSLTQEYRQDSQ